MPNPNHPKTPPRIKIHARKKGQENTKKLAQQAAIAGAAVAATAVTDTLTGLVSETQSAPVDKSLWNPVFSQTEHPNTPINQMVFIGAHNSGSEPGSGTRLINSNQTMMPYDILSQTPARALTFQVENDNGVFITNHGAGMSPIMIDHSIQAPETLQSQLDSVKQWLAQPGNNDQVVVIELGNNATTPHDQAAINGLLRQTFGKTLFDMHDYYSAETQGSWPTIHQLVSHNKHVIVLGSGMGFYDAAIPSAYVSTAFLHPVADAPAAMQWHMFGEDRTLLGNLVGPTATSGLPADKQFTGSLDTQQVDQLIKDAHGHGVMLHLDQISPNDPRLMTPEMRDQMGFDPNISLFNGLIQINRGVASTAIFSLGVFADTAAGTFAIAEGTLKAYQHYQFIQNAGKNFLQALKKVDLVDLAEFQRKQLKKQTGQDQLKDLGVDYLSAYCRKTLLDKITTDTVLAGTVGTTTMAGAIFSAGLLFPPIFLITSLLAVVTVSAGTLITSLATYLNRRALNNKLDQVLEQTALKTKLNEKLDSLKTSMSMLGTTEYRMKAKAKKTDKHLSTASSGLLGLTLALRIGSLAKYAVSIAGVISSGIITIGMFFRSGLDSVMNYRNRQTHLDNLPKLIAQLVLPPIDTRSFILFGETALEKYVRTSQHKIIKQFSLPPEFSGLAPRALLKELEAPQFRNQLQDLRKAATFDLIRQDLKDFSKTVKHRYHTDNDSLLKGYLQKQVENHISSDVLASGRMNTIKIAAAIWIGGSFFAPPLAGIFAGLALATLLIGEIVTRIVARSEKEKFKKTTANLIEQASRGNPDKNPATAELASFMHFMKSELQPKSQEKQLQKAPPVTPLPSAEIHTHVKRHVKAGNTHGRRPEDHSHIRPRTIVHKAQLFKTEKAERITHHSVVKHPHAKTSLKPRS